MTIEQLRAAVAYLVACLRDINIRALERGNGLEGEARSLAEALTDDETRQWTDGKAEIVRLEGLIARHEEIAELARNHPNAVEPGTGAFTPPNLIVRDNPFDISGVTYGDAEALRSQALRAIEAEGTMLDRHKEESERVVRSLDPAVAARIITTSSPEYGRAFLKAVAGREALFTDEERQAVARAATLGGTAGYAVPAPIDTTIIDTGAHSTNPFRQLATIKKITGTYWTGVSSAGVTASWDAESAEVSDDAPTLAQPQIGTHKGSAFVPFSLEAEDWANIASDVRMMISEAKDDLEGAAFAVGNGSTAPQGVTTGLDGTASEIAPTTAETFAKADIDKTIAALGARYRKNANWVANIIWYNAIRAFETTISVGSLISTAPVAGNVGGPWQLQVAGFPAYESSDMDAVLPNAAATADNFGLLFGDLARGYYIVDRVGLNVELIPHLFHTDNNRPKGERGFYAWFRTGAKVVNSKAIVMLSIPTAA